MNFLPSIFGFYCISSIILIHGKLRNPSFLPSVPFLRLGDLPTEQRSVLLQPQHYRYNGPPVKTTHEKIIANQIILYRPILSPEPPCYRSAQRNCPAEQGCLDRLELAGTMVLVRCPQLLNPLRTLAAAAQPARTRLSRSVACDAKQLW